MNNYEHFKLLEQAYSAAPINQIYQAKLQISKGKAEIILPVSQKYFHAGGTVHGSVYFKLLDDAAYFAVNSVVEDVFVLTVSFNIYFTRPISEGDIRSIGTLTHQSKRLYIADAQLINSKGLQIARGSGIYMRSKVPINNRQPNPGYPR